MLLHSLIALGIGIIPAYLVSPYALKGLMKILLAEQEVTLNYFSPMEIFLLQIKIAFLIDLIVCFPYLAKKIWGFVMPALHEKERRYVRSIIGISSLLFGVGVIFCLLFILPLIIRFGMSFETSSIKAMFGASNVIGLSLWLSAVFGFMFQFPLVTYSLVRSNLVTYETVKAKRPYILVIILIIAAVLTPPDIISQLMLGIPTYLLFEAGLFFSKKK